MPFYTIKLEVFKTTLNAVNIIVRQELFVSQIRSTFLESNLMYARRPNLTILAIICSKEIIRNTKMCMQRVSLKTYP